MRHLESEDSFCVSVAQKYIVGVNKAVYECVAVVADRRQINSYRCPLTWWVINQYAAYCAGQVKNDL